ncbi:NlpC/P60 family protein [Oerskovia turbata]|uniref:NlpC/P60 family protein n=2 Tax=Oerskovia turbata TaxID=1713 RepID=A0A4Q1KS04_9CELL|nr:NlpC/P60 family protein [Oerskovia turbata]RXR32913.1 NlpC/P60 family protein [Oerskovia turbata]TGJ95337.1 NlpC/P60 family protein [Actinotalea fermentans ATCC 43279 = JCM 9966 = DSM 3133]
MSMTQALTRVGEIRTEISALQDPTAARGASSAGTTGASGTAPGAGAASATDFASVLAAVGAGDAQGASDLFGSLLSSLTGTSTGSGTGSGAAAGASDLAGLFSSLVSAAGASSTGAAAGTAATGTTGAAATAGAVLETAKQYLGVPYVWGGESLAEGGLDCSGLVQLVFGAHGVDLPRVAKDQMRQGTEVASLAQAQPGDLIVQRGGKHIGIYLGDGQMIHAPKPGRTVEITPVTDASVTTIRRVLGAGAPS